MFRVFASLALIAASLSPAWAQQSNKNKEEWSGGARPQIDAVKPSTTRFSSGYRKGTIVIDTKRRRLLYVLSKSSAYLYPITVGRQGFQWSGSSRISAKRSWPDWRPPAEMRERQPNLPKVMTGGINNPLGAKALYLGSSLYRIHGTNNAKSIGLAASSGCFRMHNSHVTHLSKIAKIGTKVVVLKALPKRLARSFDAKSKSTRQVASSRAERRQIPSVRNKPTRKVNLAWRHSILGTN
jgi:lipoprotein-anchoring transpeptidase ErfK/SrfK